MSRDSRQALRESLGEEMVSWVKRVAASRLPVVETPILVLHNARVYSIQTGHEPDSFSEAGR